MSDYNNVVVSGSSVIKNPLFVGENLGSLYKGTANPNAVKESDFIFGKDAVVVFQFTKLATTKDEQHGFKAHEGEVSGLSRLVKITVYHDIDAYRAETPSYTYRSQNTDGTNLSNSSDRYGDTYLSFQTNAFASPNMPPLRGTDYQGTIPALGAELFIMPSVDLYEKLIVQKQSFTYSNVSDVDLDGDGQINPNSSEVGNGFFNGAHSNIFVAENIFKVPPPMCFCRGTLISTPKGETPIEELRVGDLVLTEEGRVVAIRWIGARVLSAAELAANPNMRPIRIRAGALGLGIPTADLFVSPQHRVLVRSRVVQRLSGGAEALVAAKHLVDGEKIQVCPAEAAVEYFHLLFDDHEILVSNGAATESFYIGPMAYASLSSASRQELLTLFPELRDAPLRSPTRPVMAGKAARQLAHRHAKNQLPFVEPAFRLAQMASSA